MKTANLGLPGQHESTYHLGDWQAAFPKPFPRCATARGATSGRRPARGLGSSCPVHCPVARSVVRTRCEVGDLQHSRAQCDPVGFGRPSRGLRIPLVDAASAPRVAFDIRAARLEKSWVCGVIRARSILTPGIARDQRCGSSASGLRVFDGSIFRISPSCATEQTRRP